MLSSSMREITPSLDPDSGVGSELLHERACELVGGSGDDDALGF
jgi:hypothetical protein